MQQCIKDKMSSKFVVCDDKNVENIRKHAQLLCLFLKETSKLTESYILDYFVEKLWTCYQPCWSETVKKLETDDLGAFLNSDRMIRSKEPWPLSLLAFRASAFLLTLPRKQVKSLSDVKAFLIENFNMDPLKSTKWNEFDSGFDPKSGQHKKIPEFCRRHVKPKKQHEIFYMGQLISAALETFDVKKVIDVGSGQGHLSRYLSLCHQLQVATVEAETNHVASAENFDKQAFSTFSKTSTLDFSVMMENCNNKKSPLPCHIEGCITSESSGDFLKQIFKGSSEIESEKSFPMETFALLGLHTCGDLASTILKLFTQCSLSKVLIHAGCCYMKLSSEGENCGYPLSSFVKSLQNHYLSYEAKEMACHALEMYIQRLKDNAPSLKIHCYRAVLEKCIIDHFPDSKHLGLRGVKNAELLEFSEYASLALAKTSCVIPQEYYSLPEIKAFLSEWKDVLRFYSLRLMIAPVVESLILLDRMLYLFENGFPSCIVPLFDPLLSPRNQILVSIKM